MKTSDSIIDSLIILLRAFQIQRVLETKQKNALTFKYIYIYYKIYSNNVDMFISFT